MNRIVSNKIRLIYTAKLTSMILILEAAFLIVYMQFNNLSNMSNYIDFFKNDLFLWILFIPALIIIHKNAIYTISFHYISRFLKKQKIISCDFWCIMISSILITIFLIFIPALLYSFANHAFFQSYNKVILTDTLFLILRYALLSVFVQWIVYILILDFQVFQKYSNALCCIPIALYFIVTFPIEFLFANNGVYIPALDFTAGKYYRFVNKNSIDWFYLFISNVHILAYMVVFAWLSLNCFVKKVEFSEDENKSD